MKVYFNLGMAAGDYRTIMRGQGDFEVEGKSIPADRVVIAEQTHSANVHVCTAADGGAGFGAHPQILDTDALITEEPELYLLIRTADCTPVLLYDKLGRAVGAIHSGREGTRKNICGQTVRALISSYGIEPQDIIAHIGAGICQQHYPVDEATWLHYNTSLQEQGFHPDTSQPLHLDIRRDIFQQLIAAGIPFKNIEQVCACTFESEDYHSFRRDGTHNRQINLIGLEYE